MGHYLRAEDKRRYAWGRAQLVSCLLPEISETVEG